MYRVSNINRISTEIGTKRSTESGAKRSTESGAEFVIIIVLRHFDLSGIVFLITGTFN